MVTFNTLKEKDTTQQLQSVMTYIQGTWFDSTVWAVTAWSVFGKCPYQQRRRRLAQPCQHPRTEEQFTVLPPDRTVVQGSIQEKSLISLLNNTYMIIIHVIELLCYNWRFTNFWLEIWSHNWRFYIDVFDACFYCLLMFSFCLFQYWTNCIPFQYILFTFLSY